jgi:hypothetical protein
MNLLSISNDSKTVKGESFGYLTGIQYFAPSTLAGGRNLCPFASEGCLKSCLYTAGRGGFNSVQSARINRTRFFLNNFDEYKKQLLSEITQALNKAYKRNLQLAIRLNGTSDIYFERIFPEVFQLFPDISFYDYSKNFGRMLAFLGGKFPSNYSLTFSRSESNEQVSLLVLKRGGNVAAVFRDKLPENWQGFSVFSGDSSDLRFLDPKGVVIGLTAKGKAKKDQSGFVID